MVPVILLMGFVLLCNMVVTVSTQGRIYRSAQDLPVNQVGVVLGTSKKISPDRPNLHFVRRVEAAANLYREGKVQHLLLSGARDSSYYNEPADMRKALVNLGVPAGVITEDPSGFRTLDSVVRASLVFGQRRYTIITDDFHVSRAVFLAQRHDQDVIGYAPEGVDITTSATSRIREVFARVKAVLDVYFLDTQPREIGQPSPIHVVARNQT